MRDRTRLLGAILLGLLVHAPALFWGFFSDDYGHQVVLDGARGQPTMRPWNLYDFGGAPQPGEVNYETGAFPWWVDSDWSVRFLRPLTSLSLWLDHALYGAWAPGYHATGLLLFALLLLAAHALYRGLGLAPGAALLATFLVAVEDGTSFTVGWVANRNSLIEALLTVLACLALVRAPRVAPRALALALALAAGAALAKESGVMAFAFVALLCWARARRGSDAEPLARRGALFAAACAALYLACLLGLGYGARSVFYPTPWGDPAAVLKGLVLLGGAAPLAMATPFSSDVLFLFPRLAEGFLPYAGVLALCFLGAGAIAWRRSPPAGVLFAGAVLALLPQAGAPISDRLYLVPLIGCAGLLALWIEAWRARAGARRLAAWLLLALAGPISALSCLARSVQFVSLGRGLRSVVLDAEVGTRAEGPREALVLNAPSQVAVLTPLTTWFAETGDESLRFWTLQLGRRPLAWTRVDARTFELRAEVEADEALLAGQLERVFLSHEPEVAPGRTWRTALFEVEAVETEPFFRGARFTLPAPLEDPRFRFLAWSDGRLRRVAPPRAGETVHVPRAEPLFPLLP